MTTVRTKRIYDPPARGDGYRVLVDRLWPRGVRKAEAALDAWTKDLAPSPELRRWFGHDPERFTQFARRYRAELVTRDDVIRDLFAAAGRRPVTLVYAAADPVHNHAAVLRKHLEECDGRDA